MLRYAAIAAVLAMCLTAVPLVGDDSDAGSISGVAFFSGSLMYPSTSQITDVDIAVGQTATVYFCSPDINGSGYFTRSDWIDDHFSYVLTPLNNTFTYNSETYNIIQVDITGISASSGKYITGQNIYTLTDDYYTATLDFDVVSTYTVTTYVGNGGIVTPSYPSGYDQSYGSEITLVATPYSGYKFRAWSAYYYYWPAGSNVSQNLGSDPTLKYTVTSDVTISASFQYNGEYTIIFDGMGGTDPDYQSTSGGKLSSIPTSTREGYTFLGWYTAASGGTQITTSTVFSGDTAVYAHWSSNTYVITFDAATNGGTLSGSSTKTVGYGEQYGTMPTASKTGYVFLGWYTSASGGTLIESSTIVATASNATLYAQYYLVVSVTVTFDPNGGSVSTTEMSTDTSGKLSTLPVPIRTGFTFLGWYTAASGGTQITTSTVFTSAMTVYAHWSSAGAVSWWNSSQNSYVAIAFVFDGASKTQTMAADLMAIPGTSRPSAADFTDSGYDVVVEVSKSSSVTIKATLYQGSTQHYVRTTDLGAWGAVCIVLDPYSGKVQAGGIALGSEVDFTAMEVPSDLRTVLDYSNRIKGNTIDTLTHTLSGSGNAPTFSVISTKVFMDTYQSVMVDPVIDIDDYYPQYGAVRLNFYSFALYGESAVFNGIDFELDGAEIAVPYYDDWGDNGKKIHIYSESGTKSVSYALTNIYLSWDGSYCWLTFADKDFTVRLGTYDDKEVSFSGIWFFTTKLWSPVTTYESSISFDWRNEFGTEQIVVLFVAALLVGFVALRIYFSGSLGFASIAMMAGAAILALFVVV